MCKCEVKRCPEFNPTLVWYIIIKIKANTAIKELQEIGVPDHPDQCARVLNLEIGPIRNGNRTIQKSKFDFLANQCPFRKSRF